MRDKFHCAPNAKLHVIKNVGSNYEHKFPILMFGFVFPRNYFCTAVFQLNDKGINLIVSRQEPPLRSVANDPIFSIGVWTCEERATLKTADPLCPRGSYR